jgi:hypothetical protein
MKITPVTLPFDLAMSDPNRGKGLHVSDIYNDYFQDTEPERYSRDGKAPDLKLAVGLAWEQYLERTLVANGVLCARPGELRSPEGIFYSPDLLIVNGQDRIGEIKATWLSSKVGPTHKKFDKFMVQAMIYCHWCEIPRVRFYVLHINGTWTFKTKSGHDPIMNIWDCDFTARDLHTNHSLLMNHAKDKGFLKKERT